jgi:hypothetical protein
MEEAYIYLLSNDITIFDAMQDSLDLSHPMFLFTKKGSVPAVSRSSLGNKASRNSSK